MQQLKTVYKAPTEEAALENLNLLDENWSKKYSLAIKSWKQNWGNFSIYFKYPEEIRTIIYTTNAVEVLHRQFRKVTNSRSIFPNDDSLKKCSFLLTEIYLKNGLCLSKIGLLFFHNFLLFLTIELSRFYDFILLFTQKFLEPLSFTHSGRRDFLLCVDVDFASCYKECYCGFLDVNYAI